MKNKKIICIIISIILFCTIDPITVAMNDTGKINNKNPINSSDFAPCFLIGIMHEKKVKIPWGYKSLWRPIFIIRLGGSNGRHVLGPFSGIIEPEYYNYTGYVGGLRFIRRPSGEGFFFICAWLIPFNY